MPEPTVNTLLNWDLSEKYTKECKDLINDFFKLHRAASQLGEFLRPKMETKRRFFYQSVLHQRATEHFASALLLLSQGYVIDAYSLSRSALEVLLLVVNFDINPSFFNHWYQDGKKFKIKPGQLRKNIKNDPRFKYSYGFFDNTYNELSELLHPKKQSVNLSLRTLVDNVYGKTKDYRLHTILLISSYNAYLIIFLSMLFDRFQDKEDQKEIDSILDILETVDKEAWFKEAKLLKRG